MACRSVWKEIREDRNLQDATLLTHEETFVKAFQELEKVDSQV